MLKIKHQLRRQNRIRALYHLPGLTRRVTRCPICGGPGVFEYENAFTPLDRCESCGHVWSRRIPKRTILSMMYGHLDYWYDDREHQGITKFALTDEWKGFLDSRIGVLEQSGLMVGPEPKHIFEIGCSEGILLKALEEQGHSARGCEMNPKIAEVGRRQLGVDIQNVMFEDLEIPEQSVDLVISFHTIEHVQKPPAVFEKIARVLNDDGGVLIEVPVGPEEYNNTDHLHFFCKKSIETLIGLYFHEAQTIDNSYTNSNGTLIGSMYGVGRHPKRP